MTLTYTLRLKRADPALTAQAATALLDEPGENSSRRPYDKYLAAISLC